MAVKNQVVKDVYFREGAMDCSMGRSRTAIPYGGETPQGKRWRRGFDWLNNIIEKALDGEEIIIVCKDDEEEANKDKE